MPQTRKRHPLVGRMVNEVRCLSPETARLMDWDADYVRRRGAVQIEFADGSKVFAACDPEGNDAGGMFHVTAGGSISNIYGDTSKEV